MNYKKYHLGDFSDEAAAAAHYDLAKKAHDEGTLADFLAAQKAAKDAHKQAAAKETPAAAAAAAAQPDSEGQPPPPHGKPSITLATSPRQRPPPSSQFKGITWSKNHKKCVIAEHILAIIIYDYARAFILMFLGDCVAWFLTLYDVSISAVISFENNCLVFCSSSNF